MGISIDEQETVIQISRNEADAVIYTSDKTMMTKLDKLVARSDAWECTKEDTYSNEVVAKTYQCPKTLISFRGNKIIREMTPEQKEMLAARMRKARNKTILK